MSETTPVRLPEGFHENVAAADYHADCAPEPSLSSSIAKILVSETPMKAWLAHPRLNPDFKVEDNGKFDLGSSVHDMLASGGKRVRVVPGFADWKKAAAQEQRAELKAQGFTPLLEHQAADVDKINTRTLTTLHERGIRLGDQEAVFVAQDRGVWLRAMMDSFAPPNIFDFKLTSINLANDHVVGRHMAEMQYDLRAYFYLRVAELVFPKFAGRLKYSWVMIEKDEPFGLRIVECDGTFKEMGRRKFEHAIGVWQRCMATGRWPHLEGLPATVEYPGFAETQWLARETKDGFVMGPTEYLKRSDEGKI